MLYFTALLVNEVLLPKIMMVGKLWFVKISEESSCDLSKEMTGYLPGETEEKHGKWPVQLISRQRHERTRPEERHRCVNLLRR